MTTITKTEIARLILACHADAWEYGRKARALTKPCGMTGTVKGDRRALNDSAVALFRVTS